MSAAGKRARAPLTLSVLQPGYLPWLGFFDQMRRSDVFVLYDDVQFDKHGWRNRNRVKGPRGPHWLTVPVLHHGRGRPRILDVRIDGQRAWARKHLETLRHFYGAAPHFDAYFPRVAQILDRGFTFLVDLDLELVEQIRRWLGLDPEIHRASELRVGGDRSERLIALCGRFGATRYLSGDAANAYLDVASFSAAGVGVEWQRYRHPVYPQSFGAFVPYLSIVDLLFHCGERSRSVLEGTGAEAPP